MGRQAPDMTGQHFGRLTVLERVPRKLRDPPHARWLCQCECGATAVVGGNALRSGYTRSCGCLRREATTARSTQHGLSNTTTYYSWSNMMRRCTHVNDPRYPAWGGRGITVCEHWLEFPNFLADMGEKPPGLVLGLIDASGIFEPGNCRWMTRAEWAASRRDSRTL